jgi:hypothetical protein
MRSVVGLLALACWLVPAAPALPCEYYETETTGMALHWPAGKCKLPYYIDAGGIPDVPDDFDTIQAAAAAWNGIDCSPFELVFAGLTQEAKVEFLEEDLEANENHVVFVKSGWQDLVENPEFDNAIALTRLSYDKVTGELYDADLMLNLQMKLFSTCAPPEDAADPDLYDLHFVALHEMGHITGLNHSKDLASVMYVHPAACTDSPPTKVGVDDTDCFCDYYGTPQYAEVCLQPKPEPGPEPGAEPAPTDVVAEQDGVAADLPGKSEGQAVENPAGDACGCSDGCSAGDDCAARANPALLLAFLAFSAVVIRASNRRAVAARARCTKAISG